MNNIHRLGSLLVCILAAGCASLPNGERDPRDRFERTNRAVDRFNQVLDRRLAKPVATAYVSVTPSPLRNRLSSFFDNLGGPVSMVNNLLQGKPSDFVISTARFAFNSTLGVGGLFDPATPMGLPAKDEDFGQTLGRWGVPSGPYLVLPLLGPSSVRDFTGDIAGEFLDPKNYLDDDALRYALTGTELVVKRAELLQAEAVLEDSFDPYAFVRNAYLQRREFLVNDGATPTDDFEIFEEEAP
jgi:phospholipid-binding lipoprotein MlaA